MARAYVRPAPHRLNGYFMERCVSLRRHISLSYYSDEPIHARHLEDNGDNTTDDVLDFLIGEGYVKEYASGQQRFYRPGIALPPSDFSRLTHQRRDDILYYANEENIKLAS